jgi:hypothetical protein
VRLIRDEDKALAFRYAGNFGRCARKRWLRRFKEIWKVALDAILEDRRGMAMAVLVEVVHVRDAVSLVNTGQMDRSYLSDPLPMKAAIDESAWEFFTNRPSGDIIINEVGDVSISDVAAEIDRMQERIASSLALPPELFERMRDSPGGPADDRVDALLYAYSQIYGT